MSIETKHKERLREQCYKKINGEEIVKTKTASIAYKVSKSDYMRQPQRAILRTSKRESRTIILARYGLLECGKNYKGTMSETCDHCMCEDNETHRLNFCPKWKHLNLFDCTEKVMFDDVYSDNLDDVRNVALHIEKVWDTRTNGSMRP